MPEGPEIRLAADRIAAVVEGRKIVEVGFGLPRLMPFQSALEGARVNGVETRGKAMLTRFDNGLTMYSHNQLYGRWFTTRRGEWPDTRRSLRVALHTRSHSALLYSASDIDVLDDAGVEAHPFLRKLGPDLLHPDTTAALIRDQLLADRFRGRSLAALYLDQSFLAGLGNYLRTEIIFHARLNPMARPKDLSANAVTRLADSTRFLTLRSYETRGVTLDAVHQKASRGSRRQRFWIFARASQPCYRCGSRILRESRSGRRIYRCPGCQPA